MTPRWLLAVGASAAIFVLAGGGPAAAESTEYCPAFHRESTEARAAGYRDPGICNVERLECAAGPDTDDPKRPREPRDDDRRDPESAVGERSIGP